MKRIGQITRLRPDKVAEYKKLHAAAWPRVLEQIASSNIKNYTIYFREPENLLFSHFEYHGTDFAADIRAMAQDPVTQDWWKLTDPCQRPLDSAGEEEIWSTMEEVFHFDG